MSKGLAQAILISSREAFRDASPMEKITPLGYIQNLLENSKPNLISSGIDDGSGYIRSAKIRYMQRGVPGLSVTTDDCSVQTRAAYLEMDVPTTLFRALGITFEDDQIAQFERDALAMMNLPGTPPTAVMKEVWDVIVSQANGLFTDIDTDLIALQAANWGTNVTTALNTAKTINFALDGTQNNLAQGMTQVMADAMINESKLQGATVVGAGLILNYSLQQRAKGFDQSGVNTSLLQLPDFKFDPYAVNWGANNFGLFENDAVQLLNICRFRGAKAGLKGGDYFFTVKLPIVDSVGQGSYREFEFDVQLTYRTCVEEVLIGDTTVSMGRGWNVILMSSYNQVNIPTNAYAAGDRMLGNNGTYLYHATNA